MSEQWEVKRDTIYTGMDNEEVIIAIGPITPEGVSDDPYCEVSSWLECTKEEARLAAAAPVLLKALESAKRTIESLYDDIDTEAVEQIDELIFNKNDTLDQIEAAIAKAEGKS